MRRTFPKARLGRWFMGAGILLLVTLLLLSGGIYWLVASDHGTRVGIQWLLSFYNQKIPGRIAVETVKGSVANGWTLEQISLLDRHRERLGSVDRLRVRLRMIDLLERSLHFSEVELVGLVIDAYSRDGRNRFTDLIVKGDEKISDDEKISLPIDLTVKKLDIKKTELIIDDVSVRSPVTIDALSLDGNWIKGDATLHVQASGGYVPHADMKLKRLAGTARLEDGQLLRIESGRIETDRGSAHIPLAKLSLVNLSGESKITLRTDTAKLNDLLPIPTSSDIIGNFQFLLTTDQTVKTTGTLRLDEAILQIEGVTSVDAGMKTSALLRARNIRSARFGAPFSGLFNVNAEIDAQHSENNETIVTATMRCESCIVDDIGEMSLEANGRYTPGQTRINGVAGISGIRVTADAALKNKNVDAHLTFDIPRLSDITHPLPISSVSGSLKGQANCIGSMNVPECTIVAEGNNLFVDGVSAVSLSARAEVKKTPNTTVLFGHADLRQIGYQQLELRHATLEVSTESDGYRIDLEAKDRRGRLASVRGKIMKIKEGIEIELNALKSTLRGVPIRLERPAKLAIVSKLIAVQPSGLALRIGNGRIEMAGAASATRLFGVRLKAKSLRLDMISAFLKKPVLGGTVTGSLEADGPLDKPTATLLGNAYRFSLNGSQPKDLTVKSMLREHDLDFDIILKRGGGPVLANVTGTLPIVVDLNEMRLRQRWSKTTPIEATWRFSNVTDQDIRPFVTLPRLISFRGSGHGTLNFLSEADFQLVGELEGRLNLPRVGYIMVQTAMDLTPYAQTAELEISGIESFETTGDIQTAVSIPKLLQRGLEIGPSRIALDVGGATVAVAGSYEQTNAGKFQFSLNGLELSRLEHFWPKIRIGGLINLEGEVDVQPDSPRLTLTVNGQDMGYEDFFLGDWSINAVWQQSILDATVAAHQHEKAVIEATLGIPIGFDVERLRPVWRKKAHHRLTYRITGLDLRQIHTHFLQPGFPVLDVESHGELTGTLRNLTGDAVFDMAMKYRELGEIPVNGRIEIQGNTKRLTLSAHRNGRAVIDGQAEMEMRLDQLLSGRRTVYDAPIIARLDVRDIDLSWFNALSIDPLYELSGRSTGNLAMNGTLRNPDIRGGISIKDGEVLVGMLTDPFTEIKGDITFQNNRWQLSRCSMRSGEGALSAAANGVIGQNGQSAMNLAAKARKFRIALAGMPTFTLDLESDTTVRITKKSFDVNLRLKKSVINHVGTNSVGVKSIPKNRNTHVIDPDSVEPTPRKTAPARSLHLTVKTDDPLRVHGASLDTSWHVNMDARIGPGKTDIQGKAAIEKGSFSLFANEFTVEEAKAYFTEEEGVDPHIALLATSTLPQAKVFVRIDGTVKHPRLNIYSEPTMSQEAIFALLVSGSDDESVSGSSVIANVVQMKYPVVTNLLYNKFEFDRVSIGSSSSGSGTVVKLGQRISEKLFLYTAFNLSAQEKENNYEVIFEYSLTDRVTLDTSAGNERSAMTVNWLIPVGPEAREQAEQESAADDQ